MEFNGQVSVEKDGRSGHISVAIDGQMLRFYWEFGGSNCIAVVDAPDPERWLSIDPLRKYKRTEFLTGLAKEIARLECPSATVEISRDSIYFYESSRPDISLNPDGPDGPPS